MHAEKFHSYVQRRNMQASYVADKWILTESQVSISIRSFSRVNFRHSSEIFPSVKVSGGENIFPDTAASH